MWENLKACNRQQYFLSNDFKLVKDFSSITYRLKIAIFAANFS